MIIFSAIKERLSGVFERHQADVLATTIFDAYNDLVKVSDFSELKGIVRELAVAQKKSKERLTRVEVAIEELTIAQQKTEARVKELAVAE
ncbi:MAG: hypothetical protein AB1797_07585 [bacterium]